jgi:hypothetical protein
MAGGALNVYVRDLRPLSAPATAVGEVVALHDRAAQQPAREETEPAEGALADFRGVAPAVQSFAAGRRR